MAEKLDLGRLDKILSRYKNKKSVMISVLQEVQEEFGWVPPETIEHIASALKVFPSEIYGILTFYTQFHLRPRGRNVIQVCLGTACYTKGSETVLTKIKNDLRTRKGEMTEDGKFSLEVVRCLGACGLAPIVVVNHDIYGSMKPGLVKKILSRYK